MRRIRITAASTLLLVAAVVAVPAGAGVSEQGTSYTQAVSAPGRSDKDRERDAREHPAEVLAFAGFKPGMHIADLFGGGGYYSEIIDRLVGPDGKVVLVNNPPYAAFAKDDLEARFQDGRLARVERRVVPSDDMQLGSGTFDGALFVMSYHDLYFEHGADFPKIDAAQFLEQVHQALKPGGRLLVVDHAAIGGTGHSAAGTLHRIDEEFAIRDIESHGFRLVGRFKGLRNAADDHGKLVFDPAVRGHTDRFVHLYVRR